MIKARDLVFSNTAQTDSQKLETLACMPTKKQSLSALKGDWTASELSVVYKPGQKLETTIQSSKDIFAVV